MNEISVSFLSPALAGKLESSLNETSSAATAAIANRTYNDGDSSTVPFPFQTDVTADAIAATFFKAVAMICVMMAAIGGNLLVIIAVFRNDRLRLLANTYLVSLAVADLLVACLVMPFSAVQELVGHWPFHPIVCDIFNANDVMFSTASLLHLGCVSVDRYVAVTDPFGYDRRITPRRVAGMLAGVWTISAALAHFPIHLGWYQRPPSVPHGNLSSPSVSLTTMDYDVVTDDVTMFSSSLYQSVSPVVPNGAANEVMDQCKFEVNWIYGVVSCAISFWLPALIMVFAYFRIYRAAQRQAKFIQSLALSSEPSTDRLDAVAASTGNGAAPASAGGPLMHQQRPSVAVAAHQHQQQQRQERRKMKREHKAAKTLGVILGAFLCCWLPFFVWYLVSAACGDTCPPTPPIAVSVLFWIGYLNSALNPVIYAAFNRDFRHSFRRSLASCCPNIECRRPKCVGSETAVFLGGLLVCCRRKQQQQQQQHSRQQQQQHKNSCNSCSWCCCCCCCCRRDSSLDVTSSSMDSGRTYKNDIDYYDDDEIRTVTNARLMDRLNEDSAGVIYSSLPAGRRMVQSVTEETSLR